MRNFIHVAVVLFAWQLALHAEEKSGARSAATSSETRRYSMLEGTESPDARYALAWGIKGVDDLATYLAGQSIENADFGDEVENYLVDVKSNKILTKVEGQYWTASIGHANRRGIVAAWAADSGVVVIEYSTRWNSESFEAFRVQPGKVGQRVDLAKIVDKPLRSFLAKNYGAAYRREQEQVAFNFGNATALSHGKWTATAGAVVPGDKTGEAFSADVTLNFELAEDGKSGLGFTLTKIFKTPEEAAQSDTGGVAAADKKLNASYKKLRAKLSEAARVTLKNEQKAWLLERDKISDEEQRARFIEARASELETRAGAH